MPKRFQSILVPIDFTVNTEVAISKALELIQDHPADLHLLHVEPAYSSNIFLKIVDAFRRKKLLAADNYIEETNKKLDVLRNVVALRHPQVKIHTWVYWEGPIEKAIADRAARLGNDLIIIGKRSHHTRFLAFNTVVPSRLAATTGLPVLTARPGSLNKTIKTVVIPVDMDYPAAKLQILEAFRHESMSIRLAVFTEDDKEPLSSRLSLVNTFRFLRFQTANPVNYEVLNGRNRAKALLKYCSKVDADVLIATPGTETRIGIWSNQHISDVLPAESRMQVLAVNPH